MNYFKSALSGFFMSFIGTALCGAKVGEHKINSKRLDMENSWLPKKGWNVPKAFLINNAVCISTSLLGAAFHDHVGKDLTVTINDHFQSDLSPYLVNAGVFGIIGTLGMGINLRFFAQPINKQTLNNFTKPWIYSQSLIEGFVIGAAAGLGAYFGDTQEVVVELFDSEIS
jgi:hypothetical protein